MPDPASSRSLEDILASIRKSLADESVDELVQLSAAAVDAARAERTRPAATSLANQDTAAVVDLMTLGTSPPMSAADALADDLLRDKLAGALVVGEELEPDPALSDLLAEPKPEAQPEEAAAETEEVAPEPAADAGLSKIWYLRPGRPEAEAENATRAPALTLDPFREPPADVATDATPTDVFNISPRDLLVASSAEPTRDAAPAARGEDDKAGPVAKASGLQPPRLDPESLALLDRLKAQNASAIEKIAKSNVEAEAAALTAASSEQERLDAPTAAADAGREPPAGAATEAAVDKEPSVSGEPPAEADVDAIIAPATEAVRPILSFPERSTPLFGAQPDSLRPIVTSVPDRVQSEPEQAAVVTEVVVKADIVPADQGETSTASEAPPQDADVTALTPAAVAVPDLLQAAAAGNGKPLEDMIAAVLEPVLQKLIETSIGPRLEELVRQEVERVLKSQRAAE